MVYYDGECGLCHAWVRFVLAHDRNEHFSFQALQSLPPEAAPRQMQPHAFSTIVVETRDGELYARSDAALYVLQSCGGLWAILAAIGYLIPRPIRDGVYRFIATQRKRIFREPAELCPVVPEAQRKRFLSSIAKL